MNKLEIKKCEYCNKVISDVSIHKDTVVFCDKDCLKDYTSDQIENETYETERRYDRSDLD